MSSFCIFLSDTAILTLVLSVFIDTNNMNCAVLISFANKNEADIQSGTGFLSFAGSVAVIIRPMKAPTWTVGVQLTLPALVEYEKPMSRVSGLHSKHSSIIKSPVIESTLKSAHIAKCDRQ